MAVVGLDKLLAELKKQATSSVAVESKEVGGSPAACPVPVAYGDMLAVCKNLDATLAQAAVYYRASPAPGTGEAKTAIDVKEPPLYTNVLKTRRLVPPTASIPIITSWLEKGWVCAQPVLKYAHEADIVYAVRKSPLGGFNFAENGLVLAGGCLCSLIIGGEVNDYDVFSINDTKEAMLAAVGQLASHLKSKVGDLQVVGTKNCITFVSPVCKVQVILTKYDSVGHILYDFDIGACAVGFYNNKLWFSEAALVAYQYQCNFLHLAARSFSYEHRIFKYVRRGFGIALPNFNPEEEGKTTISLGEGRLQMRDRVLQACTYNGHGSAGTLLVDYDNLRQTHEKNLKHLAHGCLDRSKMVAHTTYTVGMNFEKLPVPLPDVGALLLDCIVSPTSYNMTKLRNIFGRKIADMLRDQAHTLGLATNWPALAPKIAGDMLATLPPVPAFVIEYARVSMIPRDNITAKEWYGSYYIDMA
jgi:hypothetical protein